MVGVIRQEMSTGGSSMMLGWVGLVLVWRRRRWACPDDAGVVTTRMVTCKEWFVRRRLPSSRDGMMWPMPGLHSMAAWRFVVSMRETERDMYVVRYVSFFIDK